MAATRKLTVEVLGDAKNIKGTFDDLGKRTSNLGGQFTDLGSKINAALIGAGVAAAGIAAKGLFDFMQYERQLNEVFTLLPGLSQAAQAEISKNVKDFSKEFGVLPNQVIPALYQAISAGVPKDNVFEFLRVAQMAAKGGVTSLETAVDGITSVVNAYGSEVLSASQASDYLFTAVKLGKTTFKELSERIFQVAPVASALGIGLDDVSAALAAMTAQGVPTRVAATQLRSLFNELSTAGSKAADVFKEMSGKTFEDFIRAGGNTGQALDIMKEAADKAGVKLQDLFGSVEASGAALALFGNESYTAALDEMKDSAGATEEAFKTMDRGLGPLFDRLKANLSVLSIEIGEKLAPYVERLAKFFSEKLLPVLKDVANYIKDRLQAVFEKVATFVRDDLTPVLEKTLFPVLEKIVGWMKDNTDTVAVFFGVLAGFAVVASISSMVGALGFLLNPLGLIIGAIALAGAGFYYAYTEFDGFREAVDGVARFFRDEIVPAISKAYDKLKEKITEFSVWFQENVDEYKEHFSNLKLIFELGLGEILPSWEDFGGSLWESTKRTVGNITGGFGDFFGIIDGLFTLNAGMFEGDWSKMWDGIKQTTSSSFDFIKSVFFRAVEPLRFAWSLIGAGIGEELTKAKDRMVGFGLWMGSGFVGYFNFMKNMVVLIFSSILASIKTMISGVINFFIFAINRLIDKINGAIRAYNAIPLAPDISQISKISPVALAKGGIVTGPTFALIGEAGPEAVVPLSGPYMPDFLQNDGNGGTTINISVQAGLVSSPDQVGAQIIEAIRRAERRSGQVFIAA
jgi:TP901 family phage tail tape measure protein